MSSDTTPNGRPTTVASEYTVRLKGAQPLDNVPRSVKAHGHEVVSLAPEDTSAATAGDKGAVPRLIHLLVIRRR